MNVPLSIDTETDTGTTLSQDDEPLTFLQALNPGGVDIEMEESDV